MEDGLDRGGVVLQKKEGKMVSRRKILSRSRDDLNTEQPAMQEEEEDVWYQRDKLYKVRFETNHV